MSTTELIIQSHTDCVDSLLAESAKAYERCQTIDAEYQTALATTQSKFFASLRAEDQTRLSAQLTALEHKRDEAKHAYERLQSKIVNSVSWPVAPPQIQPEERERHFELVKYVNQLNHNVETMKNMLGEITSYKPPPEPLFLSSDEDDDDSMAVDGRMDVDVPIAGPSKKIPLPSRKRRRVDDSANDARAQREDMPTQQEMEEVREQLRQFEEQLDMLRNQHDQYEEDSKAEFFYAMDTKVEEIEEARLKKQRARDAQQRERDAQTQALMSETQTSMADAQKDINELSVEVSNMMVQVDQLAVKVDEETRRRDESYQRLSQVWPIQCRDLNMTYLFVMYSSG